MLIEGNSLTQAIVMACDQDAFRKELDRFMKEMPVTVTSHD